MIAVADYSLLPGDAPLLVSLPHDGIEIPPAVAADLQPAALRVPDTDWHVARLYAFARELGASVLMPRLSRYVVDLNRPPDGALLYPGRAETALCPTHSFDGEPLYRPGREPDAVAVAARRARYWQPYHDALAAELQRLRARHAAVLLWEGHSIRSRLPLLFDGELPALNLGTADGRSCAPAVQAALAQALGHQQDYGWVINGRFKGGYITRHHGQPARGVHAVQLELAQRAYMDEQAGAWDGARALSLQPLLRALLQAGLAALP